MIRVRTLAALLAGIFAGFLLSVLPATAGSSAPSDVITRVTGYKSTGFRVTYGDGTRVTYPSIRLALTECRDGLDSEGQRAYDRCVANVQTEYEWLAKMRKSLTAKGVNR